MAANLLFYIELRANESCCGRDKLDLLSLMDNVWENVILLMYICDEGITKQINLSLWLATTVKGGGFVYFLPNTDNLKDFN